MKIRCVLAALCLCGALPVQAQISTVPGLEIKGPYSSIKKNRDGTREEFEKTPDGLTITKVTKNPGGIPVLTTVYRVNKDGNPMNCDIRDGRGNRLFKSRYGYSSKPGVTFGKIVEEQMFDARVQRINPENGEEMPVRRFLYTYNADGSQNRPIALVLTPGKTWQQVHGKDNIDPSALTFDPFVQPETRPAAKGKPVQPRNR